LPVYVNEPPNAIFYKKTAFACTEVLCMVMFLSLKMWTIAM